MKKSQWRTVGVAALGILSALGGLAICARWPAANAAYPAFCGAIGFCVGAVAAKSASQHRADAEASVEAQK